MPSLAQKGMEFIRSIDDFCKKREELVEKIPEETNPDYGYIPYNRPLNKYINYGIINLDKPPGPTSHQVVAWIKEMIGVQKAGHAGTLERLPHGSVG
ncbi:MAG: hypothetical protein G5Z42_05285 [Caldisphaeraceae archaeon]|nr:hypothetical protein [Caldisphaeraceae archaeon]MEB3692359.1 hypothetical protein [Caldisphaeraceae archaeon]MEB3798213.1 hypothetical protein [Caldisphaeraceae archaeon]